MEGKGGAMERFGGPQVLLAAAREARSALSSAPAPAERSGSREEWAAVLGGLQAVIDTATAAQDLAMTRLAAIEPEVLETGELVETHRPPGHVALDAPAIVSGALSVSAVHAERRVLAAVRLVADGPEGSGTSTGLGGLHAAMAAGRLDGYRAGVVAHELEEVPPPVAASIVAGLEEWFGLEDGPHLRRRVRRMLARISPDLLRQRALRARAECRLERWVDEPGVDTWHGTFPSEDAATAWAAIDALAQRYVAEGTCPNVGRARAKALTDLVAGHATVDVQVALVAGTPVRPDGGSAPVVDPVVGATAPLRRAASGEDLVEVRGLHPADPDLVPRRWLDEAIAATVTSSDRRGRVVPTCDPTTGALSDPDGDLTGRSYRPSAALAALVRARDGHCRFPGCHVAARFCDLDHVRPWPLGPTSAANVVCLCRRHHRVKQRPDWSVRLGADGALTWTDPTGTVRTTLPLDHRRLAVLPDVGADASSPEPTPSRADGAPQSSVEFALEHLTGTAPGSGRRTAGARSRRCRPDLQFRSALPYRGESSGSMTYDGPAGEEGHPSPRRRRRRSGAGSTSGDPPPF